MDRSDEGRAVAGAVSDCPAPSGGGGGPAGRRPRRRWPIAVGVVAVALVAAGAGFALWHSQPSFCNAICHQPMDPYVEGYYHQSDLMAFAHQEQDVACLDCHVPTLEEQVTEGLSWVRGDYAMDEDGMLATVGVRSDAKMCAVEGCHGWSDVVAATEGWGGQTGVNPHASHQGEAIDCSNCHSAHGTSVMYCNTCHDYEVPAGWVEPVKTAAATGAEGSLS